VGKSLADATAALEKLNMNVNAVKGTAAPSADKVGIVYDVNPTGPQVANGTTINLTYYDALPVAAAPKNLSIVDSTVTSTQQITLNWVSYTCPAGFDVANYLVTVDSMAPVTVDKASTSTNISAPSSGWSDGSHNVTYQVTCGGLAVSAPSNPAVTFQVGSF
jgi:serine/threonine-protein kinase